MAEPRRLLSPAPDGAGPPLPERPLVSIIVPAYNHEGFIEQTLRSIEEQTYPEIEIVVVNDGSKDQTGERAKAFLATSRRRTVYLEQVNQGINKTIATGYRASHGELVCFLASDDWIVPSKIADQVQELLQHDCDAVFGNIVNVYQDGREVVYDGAEDSGLNWDPERFIARLVTAHGPMLQAGLFRRSILDRIGGVDQGIGQEDWPILILVARAARRIRTSTRPVVYYRMHATNLVRTRQVQLMRWKRQIVRRFTTGRTRRHALASAHEILAASIVNERPILATWQLLVAVAYRPRQRAIRAFWPRLKRSVLRRAYLRLRSRRAGPN